MHSYAVWIPTLLPQRKGWGSSARLPRQKFHLFRQELANKCNPRKSLCCLRTQLTAAQELGRAAGPGNVR